MGRLKKLGIISFLTVYTILLLIFCNKQGFWHDEIYTLNFLKGNSAYNFEGAPLYNIKGVFSIEDSRKTLDTENYIDNFSLLIQHEGHPPLYFILQKIWSYVFGYSELAIRSFPVICGLAFFLVLYSIIKFKSKKDNTASLFLVIALVNPFLFYFFSEARMYALGMLFAILTFYFWMKLQSASNKKSKHFIFYILFATALLYTHYYGVFFLTTLIFIDILKNGFSKIIIKSSLPVLFFMPWMIVVKKQLSFHSNHWTDGSFSLLKSLEVFLNGITELFFSPVSSPYVFEQVMAIGIITFLFILHFLGKKKYWIIGIVFYFLQIFIFDQLLDHHTIAVPRYYIFLLLLIYWGLYNVFDKVHYNIRLLIFALFLMLGVNSIYKIFVLERAPKQMYKELSNYIDNKYDDKNTLLVLESRGPLIYGITNYIEGDFDVVYMSDYLSNKDYQNVIFIEENLGISYRDKLKYTNKKQVKLTPFVGINLYEPY